MSIATQVNQKNTAKIAWIVPCYNEEVTIETVIKDIQKYCPQADIYIFNNNSTDKTAEVALKAGAQVRHVPMKGKGNVVHQMFHSIEADYYIMIDGDDTYDISQWEKLCEPVIAGEADMTVAARLKEFGDNSFRPLHIFGNKLVVTLINVFFKANLSDALSGYRVFSREFVKGLGISAKGFEIESEMTVLAMEHRFRIQEIPLPYKQRPEGSVSKLSTYSDGALVLMTLLKLVKDYKPLTFFGSLSVMFFILYLFSLMLGWEQFSLLTLIITVVSLFTGFILNSISQRSKEIIQVLHKQSGRKIS